MERHQPVDTADPSSDAEVSLCLDSISSSGCLGGRVGFPIALLLLSYLALGGRAHAATVWTGPRIDFSKAAQADPTQAANQDRITPNVWITRGGTQGIYNAKTEISFTHFLSPADTEWANGTTANYSSLSYKDWDTWAKSINGGPPSTVGVNAVVHLKSDDIYLDLKFTSWGGASGSFSYSRSTPSVGNTPPSITITNPIDATTFVGPTTLTIAADASDSDGNVTNVQFFDGATSLGNVSSSPYELTVSLAVGSHTLTAVGTDNLGASTTSSSVTVTVTAITANSPPSVSIANPINGAAFVGPANLVLQATASDTDGGVTNVQFFDGAASLGNVSSSPYDLAVSLAVGSHLLTAIATDNLGASTTSSSVTVMVIANSPPSVAITNPIDGATFIGPATVTLQATANDTDGSVTNVQFFDGTTSLGSVASSPYDLSVNLPVGSHTLGAVATDNLGASTTSPAVTVVITTNSPPSVSMTNPIDGATFVGPTTLILQVLASDNDGTVTNVQFLDGATSLGNVSSSPYEVSVNLAVGSHVLTAVATDNLGASTTSPAVTVVVAGNSPPSVAITSPTNGAVFTTPATITVQASAFDQDGTISQVQFAQNSTFLGVVTNSPYLLTISNLETGSYTLTAIATDNLNATATNSIGISVSHPPPSSVTLLNTTFAGNDFIFSFNTQTGYTYTVEFTPPLDPATWLPLTNFIGTGSLTQFSDAASTSSRYYRVGVR